MLFLQFVDLFYNLIRIKVMHHGAERYRLHIYSRAGEAPPAKVLLYNVLCTGMLPYDISYYRIFRYRLGCCHTDLLVWVLSYK